jgi:DNA topoisomerase-3
MFNTSVRYVSAKPQRLYCPTCEDTYSLPQNGKIVLYKELKCPLDKFEVSMRCCSTLFPSSHAVLQIVMFTTGTQGQAYPLCPFCYNHPPFEDMPKGMHGPSCYTDCAMTSMHSCWMQCVYSSDM